MPFAVFKPTYRRTVERVSHHQSDTPHTWYAIEFEVAQVLKSSTMDGAMVEAKRAGHVAPVLGEVA